MCEEHIGPAMSNNQIEDISNNINILDFLKILLYMI